MYFFIPTKIYFGCHVLKEFGKEISKYGNKAFIVTGRQSAVQSGVLDDLLPLLESMQIEYTIFAEITENPDIKSISRGKEAFATQMQGQRQALPLHDFIIAIGGGSPLDAGKAISIMAANDLEEKDIYNTALHKKAFPIIAIPTTSGTGSEATQYSVLSNNETKIKAGFGNELMFPKLSFVDPKYTLSLGYHVTRDTAIDALSHLLEGLYSNKYNEFLLPFICTGVKLIFENLHACLADLQNIKYRHNLMLASNYGGIVIAHSSTTLQHSIGYPLTTVYGLSHGLANGVVMKQIMDLYEPHIKKRLDDLFSFVGITKNQFFDWIDTLELQFEGKIDNTFIEKRTPEVMKSRNMTLNPFEVKENDVIKIYRELGSSG